MQKSGDNRTKKNSRQRSKVQSICPPERGFYAKLIEYQGIPIKASGEVADHALIEACKRLDMMLRNDLNIVANLKAAGAQLHIIGKSQQTSDLPENDHRKGTLIDGMDFDARTRGTGGVLASCGEENLLELELDRYHGRDICVHEFAHTILNYGVSEIVRQAVIDQHKWSLHKGLWKGCYAATNYDEFFAELSMWYFGTAGDPGLIEPAPVRGAVWFRKYDAGAFALIDDIYSGRSNVEVIEWQNLELLPPEIESSTTSQTADIRTKIQILNDSMMLLKVYWLSYQGERVLYEKIAPGDTLSQNTFASHAWLLTDEKDRGLRLFIATERPGIAIFRD